MAASSLRVLLEFGQSSRVISTDCCESELEEFIEKELRKLDPSIKLVFDPHGKSDLKGCERPVFLQRYSPEWKQFVDVVNVREIENKDRLKAVPIKLPLNSVSFFFSNNNNY